MDNQEIRLLLNYLENNQEHLNALQNEFIGSLKEHYNATWVLTKSQVESLYEMKEYIPSLVLEEAVIESESDIYRAQYSTFDTLTPFII